MRIRSKAAVLLVGSLSLMAHAQDGGGPFDAGIPTTETLAYSGTLLNSLGVPIKEPTPIALSLWDVASGGSTDNRVCETPSQAVTPGPTGRFRLPLNPKCVDAVRKQSDLYVQLQVGGSVLPRTKMAAVPYAVVAERAALALNAVNAATAANAVSATSAVRAATATTVNGSIGSTMIAYRSANCVYSSLGGLTDCACNADEYAIGGGAYAGLGRSVAESRSVFPESGDQRTWRLACMDIAGLRVPCQNTHAVCLKVSP
jgi:hypothetical protein